MQTLTLQMHDPYGHTGPAHLQQVPNRTGYLLAALDEYEREDPTPDCSGMTSDDAGDYYVDCYVNFGV